MFGIFLFINNKITRCLFADHEIASKKFKDWGLIVRPTPVILEGPTYKRETILLGNNLRKQVGLNMDWGMDVAKSAMFVAVSGYYFTYKCIFYHTDVEMCLCVYSKELIFIQL